MASPGLAEPAPDADWLAWLREVRVGQVLVEVSAVDVSQHQTAPRRSRLVVRVARGTYRKLSGLVLLGVGFMSPFGAETDAVEAGIRRLQAAPKRTAGGADSPAGDATQAQETTR
jgi:hypothetical protein